MEMGSAGHGVALLGDDRAYQAAIVSRHARLSM